MAKQNLQKQNIKNRQKKSKKKNQALQELDALETALVNNWIDDSSDFYIQEEETSIPQSANEVETLLQESSQQEMEISKPNRPQPKSENNEVVGSQNDLLHPPLSENRHIQHLN
ncbi:hypothetical protein ACLMAB_11030 [Brevibacillus laterosporus]